MINAFVSHEMRNPLNSIVAQNIQKSQLYQEMTKLFQLFYDKVTVDNLGHLKEVMMRKFQNIMKQLVNGHKVQESSASMMTFIV